MGREIEHGEGRTGAAGRLLRESDERRARKRGGDRQSDETSIHDISSTSERESHPIMPHFENHPPRAETGLLMCGRFTLTKPAALAAAFPRFRFAEFSETGLPRYNIAPTQSVLGVRNDGRARRRRAALGNSRPHQHTRGVDPRAARPDSATLHRVRRRFLRMDESPAVSTTRSNPASRSPSPGFGSPTAGRASCDWLRASPTAWLRASTIACRSSLPAPRSISGSIREPLPPEVAASILRPLDARLMQVREVSTRVNNANYDARRRAGDPRTRACSEG